MQVKILNILLKVTVVWHFLKQVYLFIFRERGREGVREGEKHQCVVASCKPPTGDLDCNPGTCPDWELNLKPLVRGPELDPLSYTSQGCSLAIFKT